MKSQGRLAYKFAGYRQITGAKRLPSKYFALLLALNVDQHPLKGVKDEHSKRRSSEDA